MPELEKKTITNEAGEEVEVYDATQVEAALKEKDDGFATEKTELETKVTETSDALKVAEEKGGDFKETREAKEKAESDLKEATEKHTKEMDELKGGIAKDARTKQINRLADGDTEVAKKIEHHLDNDLSAMPETTKEEIEAKYTAALKLSGGGVEIDSISSVISSAGGGDVEPTGSVNPELKKLGSNFGLTEDDFKKAQDAGEI